MVGLNSSSFRLCCWTSLREEPNSPAIFGKKVSSTFITQSIVYMNQNPIKMNSENCYKTFISKLSFISTPLLKMHSMTIYKQTIWDCNVEL